MICFVVGRTWISDPITASRTRRLSSSEQPDSGLLRLTADLQHTRPNFSRAVSSTFKDDHMSAPVPATRAGNCDCCSTAYRAGTPIVWDSVVAGWVLAGHRSAGSRR